MVDLETVELLIGTIHVEKQAAERNENVAVGLCQSSIQSSTTGSPYILSPCPSSNL